MMINWQKIFQLIKRTGDRCLVIDEKSSEVFVVMDFSSYEKIIFGRSGVKDLTEEQLLDKINRDISVWRASQEEDFAWDDYSRREEERLAAEEEERLELDDDEYYLEDVE